MKQVFLDKITGKIETEDIPLPVLSGKGCVVNTQYSVISSGTETSLILKCREGKISKIKRMMPEDGILSYLKRKIKSRSLIKSAKSIASSLNQESQGVSGNLVPLGYSNAGIIIENDPKISDINIDDKVACGGIRHAEFNYVPSNLFTKVPENVDLKEASFSALGCIAMQGVRRADVKIGETIAIIGQGLIGQLAAQLARVSGAHTIVSDLSSWKLGISKRLGAEKVVNALETNAVKEVLKFTNGLGADSVIICASSSTSRPIKEAIQMVRDKGKIVLVGDVKIEIPREPFYEKELDFLISRSYGPGRYDQLYEQKGLDYPLDQVRWTENRNMEEFIRLLSEGKLNVKDLITHEFDISNAQEAYDTIINNPNTTLGVLLKFDQKK